MVKPRIMLVEDEYAVAADLTARLKKLGYSICCHATSGEEAVEKANLHLPDCILMDIRLDGEMDGIDAALEIRKLHAFPIVFLTAHGEEETIKRAKFSEPQGYILKPFDIHEIRANIEIALHKSRTEQEKNMVRGTTFGNWNT